MAENFFDGAADGAAYPVFKDVLRFLGWMGDVVKQKYFEGAKTYTQRYRERHGTLKVLGMREPMSLDELYTAVQTLDKNSREYYATREGIERFHREKGDRLRFDTEAKTPGITAANRDQYLMVLGGPGMGKSTFLKKIGLEALKGQHEQGYQHSCIPVLIELRKFRRTEINILGAIVEEFRICGLPEPVGFTNKMLEKGKLLILLDGLDEVPTEKMEEALLSIRDFVDLNRNNRFVVSCRVAAYRHNFKRFTDVTIANFDEGQIRQFIMNWFRDASEQERGRACWEKLSSEEHVATKELAGTPLLLTLLCLQYRQAGEFPVRRATLYRDAFDVLLKEWAAEKELPQDKLYKGLDSERKTRLLAQVAYENFQQDCLFIDREELEEQIKQVLGELLSEEPRIDGNAVLRAIAVQHGLLVERVKDVYTFSHLTFQEFLTARHIIEDQERVDELVCKYLTEDRWREVFLLTAGLRKADYLLGQMAKQAETLLNTPRLKALMRWSDQITIGSVSDEKPVAKRLVVLAIFLALDRSLSRSRSLSVSFDLARSLALDLSLSRALDIDRALDRALCLALDLAQAQICVGVHFNDLTN